MCTLSKEMPILHAGSAPEAHLLEEHRSPYFRMGDAAGLSVISMSLRSRSFSRSGTAKIPVSPALPRRIDMKASAQMRLICLLALLVSPAAALDVKYAPST